MEDGLVNLAAIVSLLVMLLGTIPAILFLGSKRPSGPSSGSTGTHGPASH